MYRSLTILLSFLITLCMQGQTSLYDDYIHKYRGYAVEQMKQYGIPASITLAQGLLESAAGTSKLARKGNNHFGIKTGPDWKGRYMRMDDDAPNEKFRVYRSAKSSYEDHSKFLYEKPRYACLFELSPRDYKGWAHGLKKCGYATNPRYAVMLIDLIDRYDLTKYDSKQKRHAKDEDLFINHPVRLCNKSYFVIANAGDTYETIAKIAKKSERRLRKYNEVDKHYVLSAGDIVYLEKKQTEADKSLKNRYHIIKAGESLYSIAQNYGMRIKTLYKINHLEDGYCARQGEALLIRK